MNCIDLAREIQRIPAPTFGEKERAEFVAERFRAGGVPEVTMFDHGDGIVNVYAKVPGRTAGGPVLIVTAHTDTVFPAGTPLAASLDEAGRLHGPGIGDNSIAVAALVVLAERLTSTGREGSRGGSGLACDVWFVANAAEEGLGDLRGIRAATGWIEATTTGDLSQMAEPVPISRVDPVGAAVVIEGMALGSVYHRGIAVRRHEVTVRTGGGHSWGDFGTPSAIHVLMRIGAGIAGIEVPTDPKTTLNVGVVAGGTSVNTIASLASMELDLRSESTEAVTSLEAEVLAIIDAERGEDVAVTVTPIGSRPAGGIPSDHPLVVAAGKALEEIGITPCYPNGSTDANALLHAGVPAVCVGVTTGANPHRSDEWIDTAPVERGLSQLEILIRSAAGIVAEAGAL